MSRFVLTKNRDPFLNLAAEEHFVRCFGDAPLLFLWQNLNTVVIGRNQNPWAECRVVLLESEGGRLARRPSGGGAVYHDDGNINFSFIMPDAIYDVARQASVIISAAGELGVRAVYGGRNDITTEDGAKFSGSAFWGAAGARCHHGTLLVSADMGKLSRYLTPPAAKLRAKGISSVRSRVANLAELNHDITIEALAAAVRRAFLHEYGPAEDIGDPVTADNPALREYCRKYSSPDFRFGATPRFNAELEGFFPEGSLTLCLCVEKGIVREAAVFSDWLDAEFISSLPEAFRSCPFASRELAACADKLGGERGRLLSEWLMTKEL